MTFDTDMDSDVDDVGALAMLHAYEKQKKALILGIIVTSDEKYSAPCTDAINAWFGRKDIPIVVIQKDSLKSFSKYTKKIAEHFPTAFQPMLMQRMVQSSTASCSPQSLITALSSSLLVI